MINYYFDQTNELHPYTMSAEANENTIAPDNALRIKPEFKEGFYPCEKEGKWVLIEDNRGVKVYSTETKQEFTVNYLGKLKDGYTTKKPNQYDKWDGKKWALDSDAKNTDLIIQNQLLKDTLLSDAVKEISLLQDAIDLDMAEDGDVEKLKEWKKYRILLNRIDTNLIPCEFPDKPE